MSFDSVYTDRKTNYADIKANYADIKANYADIKANYADIIANYADIIANYDTSIQEKKEENAELEKQETTLREAENEQGWKAFYAKLALRAQKSKIESFLKEAGGIFNLNDEQRVFYSQLLAKRSSLTGDYKSARDLQYKHGMNATALSNRQISNCLSIFNSTLDRGEVLTQQALSQNYTQGLG